MTLPVPNLDDRGFQDLVDEAKRLVQLRNPEWTDHNVSDPGVTLIESFAYLVDQLIFRLNQVPDLHYVKFLDLLGERMIPPAAAIAPVEFWLSIAQDADIQVPRGTEVSTIRASVEPPTIFTTTEDLSIVSVKVDSVITKAADAGFVTHDEERARGVKVPMFSPVPVVGDGVYIGLSRPAPRCFVRLQIEADQDYEGIGVDPKRPPIAVEVWDGQQWINAPIVNDETGGFNRPGALEVFVPRHDRSNLSGITAAWMRIHVTETDSDQPAYTKTPEIFGIQATTIGGLTEAAHCELIEDDVIGTTSGTPGDRLQLSRYPLIAGQMDMTIDVSSANGWESWSRVESFAQSRPFDRHFTVDEVSGQLRFGPMVRLPEGGVRSYGATPPAGATVRVARYMVGGGVEGNIDENTLTVLQSSIPFVSRVTNPQAATGGMDAETLDGVKDRAAITVRTQMRAVTARDYELLTSLAAPGLARVDCIDGTALGRPGHVLIQVVPRVPDLVYDFELLQPRKTMLNQVKEFINERRPLGATVHIEPPHYLGAAVAARLALEPGAVRENVLAEVDLALRTFMHPTNGGYTGTGWPYGRALLSGDAHAVIQRVPGVAYVDVVRLVPVDVVTGRRGDPSDKIQPEARELIFCVGNELEAMS
jgi:predicted phage baseplate assembly protein